MAKKPQEGYRWPYYIWNLGPISSLAVGAIKLVSNVVKIALPQRGAYKYKRHKGAP